MMLKKHLNLAIFAAETAGSEILKIYSQDFLKIEMKSDKSPVTQADTKSNRIIKLILEKETPSFGFISEESPLKKIDPVFNWIVDPLDGTKEFISKNGEFTVNIALVRKGIPVIGVILVPTKNTLYYGCENFGAKKRVNSVTEALHVSDKDSFYKMILAKSRSHASKRLMEISKSFKSTIVSGSSVKGCRICDRHADVYIRLGNVHTWDICAMDCILKQSGGVLTDLVGKNVDYLKKDTLVHGFIASNNKIHNKLLELVK